MAGKRVKKTAWRRGERTGNPTGPWYTTIGHQTIKLAEADASKDDAEAAYCALIASGEKPCAVRLAQLADEFLADVKRHREPTTHAWYDTYLRSFVAFTGPKSRISSLTEEMVTNWIERQYVGKSDSCHHNAARCVVRMLNWAVKKKIIKQSPLIGFEKPAPSRRELP